jgi:DNA-binding IclR family transcriptional regulator
VGDGSTVSKIALVLDVLSDGKWHRIDELQQLTELDETQAQEVAAFLFEYDFAKMDIDNKRLRINKCFQKLLGQPTTC